MHALLPRFVAALAGSLLFACAAQAAAIYTVEANFVADVGNARASLPASAGGDFSAAPFTFTGVGGGLVINTAQYGQPIAGEDNLLVSGTETFTLTSAVSLYAFGFTLFQPENASAPGGVGVACYFPCDEGAFTVRLLDGATLVDAFSFNTVFDTQHFRGYAGGTAFNTIEIIDGLGTIDDEYFANFRYGTSPIPVPAAIWLVMAGLGGLGWLGRRRSS